MSWPVLIGVVLVLGIALFAAISRRLELARMQRTVQAREHAVRDGSDQAQLQHPIVDLSRCLGCATCVAVCPEEGVLDIVHGQALVVNGARCMGIAACERECPVGAITVTLSNLDEREDIPALDEGLEAVGAPGLFLAGEVTAHALIKTAIDHGSAVGAEVARRTKLFEEQGSRNGVLDLCIVGAGPAGLACALEAKRNDLRFVTIDQASGPGGTVAKYPRKKLVMTQPVDMPLHGRLRSTTYTKEELVALWEGIAAEHDLPIEYGETLDHVERDADGNYVLRTKRGSITARHVCLALGRRGTPRQLGVPGEEKTKVAYDLLDAGSYRDREILVVGGGDSAVEAAMGLAEQPGNRVTISYRKDAFFRIRGKNEQRLERCLAEGRLEVIHGSEVREINEDSVVLDVRGTERLLPNDHVFVMAGGTPPFELLSRSGVSFDPKLRPKSTPLGEQGSGLVRALGFGFVLALITLVWALWHYDYYTLESGERAAHDKHTLLRPSYGVGLWLGIAAAGLILANLVYLLRRSPRFPLRFGSLQVWMTSHVATGILAFLCTMLHGGMAPGDTPGGHAFWALAILIVTGAIGRYFYAYVPRAANGRELELAEVKTRLGRISEEWDQGQRQFRDHAREEVFALIERRQWRGSFFGRVLALAGVQRELNPLLQRLGDEGRVQGLSDDQIEEALDLARRGHKAALMVAHYEDLRAVLNTWRYLHRWVAALMVLLVALHIFNALAYGSFFTENG